MRGVFCGGPIIEAPPSGGEKTKEREGGKKKEWRNTRLTWGGIPSILEVLDSNKENGNVARQAPPRGQGGTKMWGSSSQKGGEAVKNEAAR